MLDVLARHADVAGDLVDLIALLGARQNACAAQTVNGRVVGLDGVDIPLVFFTWAATYSFQRRRTKRPSSVSASQRPQRARKPPVVYCAAFGE